MLSCMSNTLVIDCISQDELCSPLDESKLNTGKQKRRKGQKDNTSGDGELVDAPTRKKKKKIDMHFSFPVSRREKEEREK